MPKPCQSSFHDCNNAPWDLMWSLIQIFISYCSRPNHPDRFSQHLSLKSIHGICQCVCECPYSRVMYVYIKTLSTHVYVLNIFIFSTTYIYNHGHKILNKHVFFQILQNWLLANPYPCIQSCKTQLELRKTTW